MSAEITTEVLPIQVSGHGESTRIYATITQDMLNAAKLHDYPWFNVEISEGRIVITKPGEVT